MSLFTDQKYALMLPVQGFDKKTHGNYFGNCRCPICGDSKFKQSKKRFWFYNEGNKLTVHCFNCGYTSSFFNFLKSYFPSIHEEYLKETYFEKYSKHSPNKQEVACDDIFVTVDDELDLTKVGDLPRSHPVVKYILKRQIPLEPIVECYYSDNFYGWCKQKQPDTFEYDYKYDRRLIFPFKDRTGRIFGLSGRSIDNRTPKYVTIKLIGDYPKVYGYDRLNIHKPVYITEGQIDSLFIDNCIGAIGALGSLDIICEYCMLNKQNVIVVVDNEKRNKQTCDFIKKNLLKGYKISLWPKDIKEKDINDMILNGKTQQEIMKIINKNVIEGTKGLLKLANWRKA